MKLLFRLTILTTIVSLFFLNPVRIYAIEQIDNYDIYVKINQNSEISIVENINYNFGQSKSMEYLEKFHIRSMP